MRVKISIEIDKKVPEDMVEEFLLSPDIKEKIKNNMLEDTNDLIESHYDLGESKTLDDTYTTKVNFYDESVKPKETISIEITPEMQKDIDTCNTTGKDCTECSCNMCVFQS